MSQPFIKLHNAAVRMPLHRKFLRRRLISGNGSSGGNVVEIDGVSYVQALTGIDLSIEAGDCVALIGPNGAGKTTLLRALAGVYELNEGSIEVSGRRATLFSNALALGDHETGLQNIEYSGILRGIDPNEIQNAIPNIAEICDLGEFLNMPVSLYSEGMRSRLGLAMAIISKPDIFLLDEAMNTIDLKFLNKVVREIGLFTDPDRITVLATHDQDVLKRYCGKAVWLDKGHLRAFGAFDEVYPKYQSEQI